MYTNRREISVSGRRQQAPAQAGTEDLTYQFQRLPNGTMRCLRCGEIVRFISKTPTIIGNHPAFGCPNGCDRDLRTIVQLLRALYVPERLIKALDRAAGHRRINVQQMLTEALNEYFNGAVTNHKHLSTKG